MKGRTKLGLYVIILVILSNATLASVIGGTEASINIPETEVRLTRGESTSIPLIISNENTFCSLTCYYEFKGNKINLGSISGGSDLSIKIPISSTSALNEYVETLYVYCKETYVPLMCLNDMDKEESKPIRIIVELTAEEKQAKEYVKNKLDVQINLLQKVEQGIYNLDNKFNNLPSNLKVSDLKSSFTNSKNKYDSYHQQYDRTKDLWDSTEYLQARSQVNENLDSELNTLLNDFPIILNKLNERIARHNQIIKDFKKIKAKLEQTLTLGNRLTKENDNARLESDFNQLVNEFDNGLFDTYTNIEKKVSDFQIRVNNKFDEWQTLLNEVLNKGKLLLKQELSKLCKGTDCQAMNLNNVYDIESLCSDTLAKATNAFKIFNTNLVKAYNKETKTISEKNSKLSAYSTRIVDLNTINEEIRSIIQSYRLDVDTTECSSAVNALQSLIDQDKIDDLTTQLSDAETKCADLKKKVTDLKLEKESSFWFKFEKLFFFLMSKKEVEIKEVNIKLNSFPDKPKTLIFNNDTNKFFKSYCDIDEVIHQIKSITDPAVLEDDKLKDVSDIDAYTERETECCLYGKCDKCCKDCSDKYYPVVLVHGHAVGQAFISSDEYALDSLQEFQRKLEEDGYVNAGVVVPSYNRDVEKGSWGKINSPISVRVTYYEGTYDEKGNLIGGRDVGHSITYYADKLDTVIEKVLLYTGKNKVNIIAHSMGGLVSREYIRKQGKNKVNKIVIIGTPNHGIWNRDYTEFILIPKGWIGCGIGSFSPECKDMAHDSIFLQELNKQETFPGISYLTIAGKIDEIGDTTVRYTSVELDGATNKKFEGTKYDHSGIISPQKTPDIYQEVVNFIK